jgi:ferredoxin
MTRQGSPAPQIDFLSPEFNRIDPLQAATGNFRTFETLEGVVTADMRHQAERARAGAAAGEAAAAPRRPTVQGSPPWEPVAIVAEGRVLVVAREGARAVACAASLGARGLTCTPVLIVDGITGAFADDAMPAFAHPAVREASAVRVRGAFGCFSAGGDERFDCVLDLLPAPCYAGPLLPLGYYHAPETDAPALAAALAELPQMRGRFEKPRFTAFDARRCLHRRARAGECRRCREICPFDAIQEVDKAISVDPLMCQGCGSCALVCPSLALRLVVPSPEAQVAGVRAAVRALPAGATGALTIRDAGADAGEAARGPGATVTVGQTGHVRVEMLLAALAEGAASVAVVGGANATEPIRDAVRREVAVAEAILRGCGLPAEAVRFEVSPRAATAEEASAAGEVGPAGSPAQGAPCPPLDGARHLAREAAQRLYERTGSGNPALALPAGAPFGAVIADSARCTLCMACVSACPAGALAAAGDTPRLVFRESLCVQCGLCAQTCPEGALRLVPRLLCDPRAVDAPVALHEAEAARCQECGTAFAPRAMVERMRERLRGHWMYAGDSQLRRLELCATCRARDTLTSGDAARWSR